MNEPRIFYTKVRPYMAGWENSVHLPQGLLYESNLESVRMKFAGASAGQSPIIHCLDVALGVVHYPTSKRSKSPERFENKNTYIYEMRKYMLREHREFISALSEAPSVKDYVHSLDSSIHSKVIESYNSCIESLTLFRNFHIQLVTRYIILPSKKEKNLVLDQSSKETGTGGTGFIFQKPLTVELMPFLQQMRSETMECTVSKP